MRQPFGESLVTVQTTGLDIHYREWRPNEPFSGPALPPVLLLHGLASSCRIYDLCAPLLQGRRVIAYDQRGHGLTGKTDDGYDLATLIADGRGLAQALALPAPYIVVGHSWGASVALAWVDRHPQEVHAGVLVDGAVTSFRDLPGATWNTVEQRFGPPSWQGVTFETLLEHTRHGDLAFLDEPFRRLFFESLVESNGDGTVRGRLLASRHWQILRSMWEYDLGRAIAAARRPLLALLAAPPASRQHLVAIAARRQALQPLLTVRWLADTIHDIPLQHPALLAAAIADL